MPSALSDDELMEQIKAGNSGAFATLFDRHASLVLGYCLRTLAGNRSMAEDISQEVWIRVARKASLYEAKSTFRSWLMTITRNIAIDEIRKQKMKLDELDDECPAVDPDDSVERKLIEHAASRDIEVLVDSLPAPQRLAFILSFFENLSYKEIGEAMHCSEDSVRSHLFRAKRSLREKWGRK